MAFSFLGGVVEKGREGSALDLQDGAPTYPGDPDGQPTLVGVPRLPAVWERMPRMYWEPDTKKLKWAPGPELPELLLPKK